jgi:two-component system chemotaxis response regulator CheB
VTEPRVVNAERIARDVIVLGASAGGVRALLDLFGGLPADFHAAIAVVLHRSPVHRSVLDVVLGRRTLLPVIEPSDGQALEGGRIYLAPRDHHLLLDGRRLRLTRGPKQHYTRPAIDPLFVSAAAAFGRRVVGVVLSGTGDDGARGLIAIKAAGGLSLVQSPDEAQYPAMPQNAVAHDRVSAALPARELAAALPVLARGAPFTPQESSRGRQATPA